MSLTASRGGALVAVMGVLHRLRYLTSDVEEFDDQLATQASYLLGVNEVALEAMLQDFDMVLKSLVEFRKRFLERQAYNPFHLTDL